MQIYRIYIGYLDGSYGSLLIGALDTSKIAMLMLLSSLNDLLIVKLTARGLNENSSKYFPCQILPALRILNWRQ